MQPEISVIIPTLGAARARRGRQGMFVALGPRIAPGPVGRTVAIADLAPTFCASLGVELPDVDGRAIPEIVAAAEPRSA